MKKRIGSLVCLFLLLITSFSFPIPSQAKVIVKSYQELKEQLEYDGSRQIELGADISLTDSITIRGIKKINGKGHVLERSKTKGKVYGGTLFLMLGKKSEWKNVTVSGGGKAGNVVGKVFGRLLEARQGKTILGSGCIWKNNINDRLAVDGGGALWIKKGAQCHIQGGEISHNENVSRGAGVRVEKGAQLVVEKGRLVNNVVRGIDAAEGFEGLGAAIYNEGKVTIKGGSLEGNRAVAYTNNVASYGGAGGAVYNRGDCTIMGGAIRNNHASLRGSAVYSDRHASLKLSGGALLSNWDAENRSLWLGGSCTLDKNVSIQQLFIASSAFVTVKKNWRAKQKVMIEPSSYAIGYCIMHGVKGNFVLKEKSGLQLIYKRDGYYIARVKRQNSQKTESKARVQEDKKEKTKETLLPKPQIVCENDPLIFYEGEYVTKEVLGHGVSAIDAEGRKLSVTWKGKGIKKEILDTTHAGKGSITFRAKDSHGQVTAKIIKYVIKKNKKPVVRTIPQTIFLDEIGKMSEEQWKAMLWESIRWQDDYESMEELKRETIVEYSNFKEKRVGNYRIQGHVRDQYGHRYYMKPGERRRYGEGRVTTFFIDVTIVERRLSSQESPLPLIRFVLPSSATDVIEEWHFDSRAILEIQKFMDGRADPFSQETNQEFIRMFQKYRRAG